MTIKNSFHEIFSEDELIQFFRGLIIKMLGGGMVLFLTLSGWLLSSADRFSFNAPHNTGKYEGALIITLLSMFILFVWTGLTYTLRKKSPEHWTIPSKKFILFFCFGIIIMSGIVIYFVVKD
jgi:hypothetical protein